MPLRLVTRRNSPNWYVRGTVRGRPIYESTGIGFADRDLAEARRIQIESEELERSVFGERAVQDFAGAALIYMRAGGEARFLKPLIEELGRDKVAGLDQARVDRAARKLYPGAAPATLNRQVYTPVSAVLAQAGEFRRFRRPKAPSGKTRFFTPAEAERLIEASAPHMKPLITFLIGTGARTGEALALDWADLRLDEGKAIFWNTKNGEMRGLPLSERVIAAVAGLRHRDGPVFRTGRGAPYADRQGAGGQIKTAFAGALRRARLEHASPHTCRHTFGTWYYSYTRDVIGLMAYGGWKSEAMVRRYAHLASPMTGAEVVRLGWAISAHYWAQPQLNDLKALEK